MLMTSSKRTAWSRRHVTGNRSLEDVHRLIEATGLNMAESLAPYDMRPLLSTKNRMRTSWEDAAVARSRRFVPSMIEIASGWLERSRREPSSDLSLPDLSDEEYRRCALLRHCQFCADFRVTRLA